MKTSFGILLIVLFIIHLIILGAETEGYVIVSKNCKENISCMLQKWMDYLGILRLISKVKMYSSPFGISEVNSSYAPQIIYKHNK